MDKNHIISQPNEHLKALTGLRGVLALWVLMLHITMFFTLGLKVQYEEHFGSFLTTLFWSGYLAVDAFFMLSGFVLCHVYLEQLKRVKFRSSACFILLRLARIYPIHLFILFLYAVLVWGIEAPLTNTCFPYDPKSDCNRFSPSSFLDNLFLVHAWDWFPKTSWNVVSWSISSEWAAYLLFPFFVPILMCVKKPFIALVGAIVSILLSIFIINQSSVGSGYLNLFNEMLSSVKSPYTDEHMFKGNGGALEFGLIRIAGGFLSGCFLYRLYSLKSFNVNNWTFISLSALLGVAICIQILPTYWSKLLFIPLLFSLAHPGHIIANILESRFLVWMGKISFSLYMLHSLVIQVIALILRPYYTNSDFKDITTIDIWFITFLIILCAIAFSAMLYYYVEEPSRKALRRLADNSDRLSSTPIVQKSYTS